MVIFSVGLFRFLFFQLLDINHSVKLPCNVNGLPTSAVETTLALHNFQVKVV